ncbi:single-stranded DNA-binding protein [Kitasatospora sp. NPDC057542]|uniref:single-stranded DNA-binding protein n=1 Tax=Streptomycetaceae TaxID=2062 RepID=UPI001CCCCA4B|nr:single-stranded DNA-binding protein [Streptomyces sp. LS1784]
MNLPNHTTLIGSLLQDPELYEAPGAPPRVKFTLLQRPRLAEPGQPRDPQDRQLTVRCVALRDLAHRIAETLRANDRVIVIGRLTQRVHQPPGESPRLLVEVTVEAIGTLL